MLLSTLENVKDERLKELLKKFKESIIDLTQEGDEPTYLGSYEEALKEEEEISTHKFNEWLQKTTNEREKAEFELVEYINNHLLKEHKRYKIYLYTSICEDERYKDLKKFEKLLYECGIKKFNDYVSSSFAITTYEVFTDIIPDKIKEYPFIESIYVWDDEDDMYYHTRIMED